MAFFIAFFAGFRAVFFLAEAVVSVALVDELMGVLSIYRFALALHIGGAVTAIFIGTFVVGDAGKGESVVNGIKRVGYVAF